MGKFDRTLFDKVLWNMPGDEIERESFRRIEAEYKGPAFPPDEWRVVRRLIHTTADFGIAGLVKFGGDPFAACRAALSAGAPIYCDSNMIRSGISVDKLRRFNPSYSREKLVCHIADPDVAEIARAEGISRALASVRKARSLLGGSIVLVGNAPLALAGIVRLAVEEGIRPAVVIGMPVGFVNVVESKALLCASDLPYVTVSGRRGGSTLAVAALHAMMEEAGNR